MVAARLVRRGVVLRQALIDAGVPERTVDIRVERRDLHPFMGPGAYLLGHDEPPPLAREYAALQLGGERSALSFWTAGALWEWVPPRKTVHLSLSAQRRDTDHLQFHRATLMRREVWTLHGDIRLTSPARTIADLSPLLGEDELERVIGDAIRRKLTTAGQLAGYATNRRGARKLRGILQIDGGPQWTRSKAEREFLKLVRAAGLPSPRMNQRVDGRGRDALWDEEKVLAEIDGWTWHGQDVIAFTGDRRRDSQSAARGWLPLRYPWRRVRDEPLAIAAELGAVLSLRRRS